MIDFKEITSSRARPVILQVLPSLETGGVERGCVDIAKAITDTGSVAVVASNGASQE